MKVSHLTARQRYWYFATVVDRPPLRVPGERDYRADPFRRTPWRRADSAVLWIVLIAVVGALVGAFGWALDHPVNATAPPRANERNSRGNQP